MYKQAKKRKRKIVNATITVDAEIHDRFRAACRRRGWKVGHMMGQAMALWLVGRETDETCNAD